MNKTWINLGDVNYFEHGGVLVREVPDSEKTFETIHLQREGEKIYVGYAEVCLDDCSEDMITGVENYTGLKATTEIDLVRDLVYCYGTYHLGGNTLSCSNLAECHEFLKAHDVPNEWNGFREVVIAEYENFCKDVNENLQLDVFVSMKLKDEPRKGEIDLTKATDEELEIFNEKKRDLRRYTIISLQQYKDLWKDIREVMLLSVSSNCVDEILNKLCFGCDEFSLLDYIIFDVVEHSGFLENGTYSTDDIRLAIGRVLAIL